jgi:hypothetical protein
MTRAQSKLPANYSDTCQQIDMARNRSRMPAGAPASLAIPTWLSATLRILRHPRALKGHPLQVKKRPFLEKTISVI